MLPINVSTPLSFHYNTSHWPFPLPSFKCAENASTSVIFYCISLFPSSSSSIAAAAAAAAVLVSLSIFLPPPLSLSLSLIFSASISLPLTPPVFLTIFFCHPSLPLFSSLSLTERLQAPALQTVCWRKAYFQPAPTIPHLPLPPPPPLCRQTVPHLAPRIIIGGSILCPSTAETASLKQHL